ncbi:transglutaminase TgpA family protein [Corallincola luteus]|nr:DUF3488 and transglutaminase-like domain-containing protein [Corallincola luteus]
MTAVVPSQVDSRRLFFCLMLVHWAVFLPIYDQIYPLFYFISLFAIGWRAGSLWLGWRLPSKFVVTILSLGGAVALVLLARQLGLLATMINLLLFAYALKFIELKGLRDLYTLVLIGIFLVGVSFIFQQGMGMAAYLLVVTLLSFYCMHLCQLPVVLQGYSYSAIFRQLLAALPLALILFLILPRLGPLWKMPDAKKSVTGLSEEVSPGDIAELGRSSKLAFRVTFDRGAGVRRDQFYWRAMVHEQFTGRSWRLDPTVKTWRQDVLRGAARPEFYPAKGSSVYYTIIAEPTFRNWLYGLDNPRSEDRSVLNAPGNILYARRIVSKTKQYAAASVINGQQSELLTDERRQRNLDLPTRGNPEARLWAEELAASYDTAEEISDVILQRFRQQAYFYTLRPPLLGDDPIDQFLFSTQAGFCEHYASAYAFVMRAAGVPARVVTGYLGGEYNPGADYYSIYQFDAHAWVEIWIDGEGWRRVDPTAAVAPERVLGSLEDALATPDEFVSGDPFSLVRYRNIGWITEMRHLMALVDYRWTVWVLNYSNEQQLSLLRHLFGQLSHWKMVFIGLGSLLAGAGLLFVFGKINWQRPRSPMQRFCRKVQRRLLAKGIAKDDGESFASYLARAADLLQQDEYRQIAAHYRALRYQAIDESNQLSHWQSMKKIWRKL